MGKQKKKKKKSGRRTNTNRRDYIGFAMSDITRHWPNDEKLELPDEQGILPLRDVMSNLFSNLKKSWEEYIAQNEEGRQEMLKGPFYIPAEYIINSWYPNPEFVTCDEERENKHVEYLAKNVFEPMRNSSVKKIREIYQSLIKAYQVEIRFAIERNVRIELEDGSFAHILSSVASGYMPEYLPDKNTLSEIALSGVVSTIEYEKTHHEYLSKGSFDENVEERNKGYGVHYKFDFIMWYYYEFGICENKEARKKFLKIFYFACKQGDERTKESIMHFYESNVAEFAKLFAEFPKYDFILHGRYQTYRTAMELANGIGITLNEKNDIIELFSQLRHDNPEKTGKRRERIKPVNLPKIDRATYREYVVRSLDEIFRKIIHRDINAHYINYDLNKIRNYDKNGATDAKKDTPEDCEEQSKKEVKARDRHIGIAFYWNQQYWILADCLEPGNAVYMWHGDDYEVGKEILRQNRTYARQQKGITHCNHWLNREHFADTYARAFLNAGCYGILQDIVG